MCNVPKNPSRHPCPRAADDSRCTVTVPGPQKLKVRLNVGEVDETGFGLTAPVVQRQLFTTTSANQYHSKIQILTQIVLTLPIASSNFWKSVASSGKTPANTIDCNGLKPGNGSILVFG